MSKTEAIVQQLRNNEYNERMIDIYVDPAYIPYQTKRYTEAITSFTETFRTDVEAVFSAPGRSEVGGNHTDHQHGEVLAASIHDDAIAVTAGYDKPEVQILSKGYEMITISLDSLEKIDSEEGTTAALIRGVLSGMKNQGYQLGGFQAYITSDVLSGSGLSSSAAFETLIGTIVSGLFNHMKIFPIEIAKIGQYAENVYFGKPCGLMDQMACSVGSLCHIDFADCENPKVSKIDFDLETAGYSLCITDTKGSHADLTADYAAIPAEMKSVARYFSKEFLIEVAESEVLANAKEIREKCGDRAFLRAIHFFEENKRVQKEVAALKAEDMDAFLSAVLASGNSSCKYLQNVYTDHNIARQNMSVALMLSELTLGAHGVARVHGGGFAGTIQAFVKNDVVSAYKCAMDEVFGTDSCKVLRIRKYGGIRVL